jgi:hypothetical protein
MDARGGGIGRGEDRERRGTTAGRPVGRASWAVLKQSSRWRWAGDPARCRGGGGRGPVLGARALRNCARPRGPPSGRPGVALRARLAADRCAADIGGPSGDRSGGIGRGDGARDEESRVYRRGRDRDRVETESETEAEAEAETETETESETESEAGAETGTESGAETETESEAGAGAETG